jgi:hypothetical protein
MGGLWWESFLVAGNLFLILMIKPAEGCLIAPAALNEQ